MELFYLITFFSSHYGDEMRWDEMFKDLMRFIEKKKSYPDCHRLCNIVVHLTFYHHFLLI